MKKSSLVFKVEKVVENKFSSVKLFRMEECWTCGKLPCECKNYKGKKS